MTTVLFLGKSDRRIELWAKAHARLIKSEQGRVIFLAPYGRNYREDNFTFINCFSVALSRSVQEIQDAVGVSINRILACDRSLTDYSSSTSYGSYSRYSVDRIEHLVRVVGNAILDHIDEVDYCVDGLFDNFITPLAFYIARKRGVRFHLLKLWHYWHDRFHIVDLPGYASSAVNDYYRRYYRRLPVGVYPRVKQELLAEKFHIGAFTNEDWRFRMRIRRDKFASYERPALLNFLRRRLSRLVGAAWARGLRFTPAAQRPSRYIVFALHVMPEAAILGTDPEIADQFSLIRRMSMSVPLGVQILCKAHPGDRFGRDIELGLVRRLCSLHNVSLVPEAERIDSFLQDPRCLAVATINGSVAMEAVMEGKPCFVFGKGIFAIADCFLKPRDDNEFFEQVSAIARGSYSIDRVAIAAIILSMKRALIRGTRSAKQPGPWLDFYSSLLPSVHRYDERLRRRGAPR